MKPTFLTNQPIILAHRGGSAEAPENTLQAFRAAAKQGFTYFETDVHLAEDGKLYLYHGPLPIKAPPVLPADNPYDDLESLLVEFPEARISIDAKHEPAVEPLARLIAKTGAAARVCIAAPSDDTRIARIADCIERLTGERPVTALSNWVTSFQIVAQPDLLMKRIKGARPQYIDLHYSLISRRTITAAHNRNLKIIAWTVNKPKMMQRFLELGVDGFMTDYPSRAQQFLQA